MLPSEPKPGETWLTERGKEVLLEPVSGNSAFYGFVVFGPPGHGAWKKDGTTNDSNIAHELYGSLIRRVSSGSDIVDWWDGL